MINLIGQDSLFDSPVLGNHPGETRTALWGLGCLVKFRGLILTTFALWPKIKDFIESRAESGRSEDQLEETHPGEEGNVEEAEVESDEAEEVKNYSKRKYDRRDRMNWE